MARIHEELLLVGAQEALHSATIRSFLSLPVWTTAHSDKPSWEASVIELGQLGPGKYRIRPDAESRWSLASGVLVTDFHGLDATMDGHEIGIPANPIRIGSVLALLHWINGLGVASWDLIQFPPGTNFHEFEVLSAFDAPVPVKVQFTIADRAGAYGDNCGCCRVWV